MGVGTTTKGGLLLRAPNSLETMDPKLGNFKAGLGRWPVRVSMVPWGWFLSCVFMERMIDSLSMCLAMRGKISEIWTPGALVEIGLKPLLAFTSQVSRWLIPTSSHSTMTDWDLGGPAMPR